jgi:hypothetical protein
MLDKPEAPVVLAQTHEHCDSLSSLSMQFLHERFSNLATHGSGTVETIHQTLGLSSLLLLALAER